MVLKPLLYSLSTPNFSLSPLFTETRTCVAIHLSVCFKHRFYKIRQVMSEFEDKLSCVTSVWGMDTPPMR